jgi:hypothetical protein
MDCEPGRSGAARFAIAYLVVAGEARSTRSSVCRLVAPGVIATSVEQIGCAEFERGQINTIRKTYDDATTFRRREDVDDEARGLR